MEESKTLSNEMQKNFTISIGTEGEASSMAIKRGATLCPDSDEIQIFPYNIFDISQFIHDPWLSDD